jgi:orotate phosphoribosyltransferase
MTKAELAREIYRISHLTGQFKLRSGQMSSEYFDKYRFESEPRLLKEIAAQMTPLIPPSTELLAGLELGGVPVATALSLATGIPALFVRKSAKDYGTCQLAEGKEIAGQKICVIEDVITTGGQVLKSIGQLRELGAEIVGVICVIYRNPEPIERAFAPDLGVAALFTKAELERG